MTIPYAYPTRTLPSLSRLHLLSHLTVNDVECAGLLLLLHVVQVLEVFTRARMRRRVDYAGAGGVGNSASSVSSGSSSSGGGGGSISGGTGGAGLNSPSSHHPLPFRRSVSAAIPSSSILKTRTFPSSSTAEGPTGGASTGASGRANGQGDPSSPSLSPPSSSREIDVMPECSPLQGVQFKVLRDSSFLPGSNGRGARRYGRVMGRGGGVCRKRPRGSSAFGALILTSHRVLFMEHEESTRGREPGACDAPSQSSGDVGDLVQIPLAFIAETRVKRRTHDDVAGIQVS